MLWFRVERGSGGMKCCRKMMREGSKLVWAQWEESVTRCDDMVMTARGEATPERGKRGDNVSWADANITRPKNEENPHDRFNY
jgi:hypothetical protein